MPLSPPPRRVADQLQSWLSRVEVLARGGERLRMAAVAALKDQRPWDAHSAARRLVELVPESRQGLLLWADAAEAAGLEDEVGVALERLAALVPYRSDVWLRLAHSQARAQASPRESLERADSAAAPSDASDAARIWLCDLDLWQGDVGRAERWLERCGLATRETPAWRWRLVEVRLDNGKLAEASAEAARLPKPEPLDARAWLTQGRIWAEQEDPAAAWALERGLLLEAPRSGPVLASYLVRSQDAVFISRIREVVQAFGWDRHPGWQAAFAEAEGRLDQALSALAQGAAAEPDVPWMLRYAEVAERARDRAALDSALGGLAALGAKPPLGLGRLKRALDANGPAARIEHLAGGSSVSGWSQELLDAAFHELLDAPAWPELLDWLGALAFRVGDVALRREVEAVSVDLERPLRVAIVGEFNAGKSSFINAWLGSNVAPVGVLPTTAKSHRLAWAPDPYVRLECAGGAERVLPHAALSLELASQADVERVVIFAPRESLRYVELIDTPGFNSGSEAHTQEVEAALSDSHVALWLLDASQPLKASELQRLLALKARNLPLVVVINKQDRLQPSEREACIEHVRAGLAGAGLEPVYPCILVSARMALDPELKQGSGWEGALALLDYLRAERSELRSGVLLRRLAQALQRFAGAEPAPPSDSSGALKSRLGVPGALEGVLDAGLLELRRDLRPLEDTELDPSARLFAAARARTRVAAAVDQWLSAPGAVGERSAAVAGAWATGAWPRLMRGELENAAEELRQLLLEPIAEQIEPDRLAPSVDGRELLRAIHERIAANIGYAGRRADA